jgi:hypothetical protein
VPSVEWSSTTITSRRGHLDARALSTQRTMLCASFRAGITIETIGASSPASACSAFSVREWRARASVRRGTASQGRERRRGRRGIEARCNRATRNA